MNAFNVFLRLSNTSEILRAFDNCLAIRASMRMLGSILWAHACIRTFGGPSCPAILPSCYPAILPPCHFAINVHLTFADWLTDWPVCISFINEILLFGFCSWMLIFESISSWLTWAFHSHMYLHVFCPSIMFWFRKSMLIVDCMSAVWISWIICWAQHSIRICICILSVNLSCFDFPNRCS